MPAVQHFLGPSIDRRHPGIPLDEPVGEGRRHRDKKQVDKPEGLIYRVLQSGSPPVPDTTGVLTRHEQTPTIRTGIRISKRLVCEINSGVFNFFEKIIGRILPCCQSPHADTTGAICEQLAGAYWVVDGIPHSLKDGLAGKEMLESSFEDLMARS